MLDFGHSLQEDCGRVLFWFYFHSFVSCHYHPLYKKTVAGCYSGFTFTVLCHVIITLFTRRLWQGVILVLLSQFCVMSLSPSLQEDCGRVLFWFYFHSFVSCHYHPLYKKTVAGCYSGFTFTVLCHVIITLFTRRLWQGVILVLLSQFCVTSLSPSLQEDCGRVLFWFYFQFCHVIITLFTRRVTGCYSGFTFSFVSRHYHPLYKKSDRVLFWFYFHSFVSCHYHPLYKKSDRVLFWFYFHSFVSCHYHPLYKKSDRVLFWFYFQFCVTSLSPSLQEE